jgi:hypothetical protein
MKSLFEEIHFFLYHYHLEPEKSMRLSPILRKWLINRFIEQKEQENQAMEAARKKATRK